MKDALGILGILLVLTGCTTTPSLEYPPEKRQLYLSEILGDGPAPEALITLELNDEIRADLDARIDPKWMDQRKLRALRHFLFREDERGITYDANASKTAIETYNEGRGNCLSMTNLFVAAARYVGLDAGYQTVVVKPTWGHEGATLIRYEHIVASGRVSGNDYVVDFLPEFLIGDQPTEEISDREALALYYNNLGAEAVVENQPDLAITYLRQALKLTPEHSNTWNNMGAAQRRAGRDEHAEFAYFESLKFDGYNYSALSNLAGLYEATDRLEKAEEMRQRVARYRRRNPYFYFFIAKVFFDEGRYDCNPPIFNRRFG